MSTPGCTSGISNPITHPLELPKETPSSPPSNSRYSISDTTRKALMITGIVLACLAVIAGLAALTFFFPHVMIPIYEVTGVIAAITLFFVGAGMAAFAAGSGDSSGIGGYLNGRSSGRY